MHPFRKAFATSTAPAGRRGLKAEAALGYEIVDFNQQPINLYATELSYCEPHWHEASELVLVLRGSFEVLMDNRSTILKESGLVFVRADDLHTVHAKETGSVLLAVQFSPTLNRLSVDCPGRDPSLIVECLSWNEPAHRDVLDSLADLARYVLRNEPVFGDYGLLRRVFTLLERVRLVRGPFQATATGTDAASVGNQRQIEIAKHAIAFANDNYLEDIKLLDVARSLQVSYHHLSHTFKAITGFNFREYLTLLRLNKARELLRDDSLNITKISSSSGFSEHKHLDAAFKKYFATTPTQYRKKYLNQVLLWRENATDGVNRLLMLPELESFLEKLVPAGVEQR